MQKQAKPAVADGGRITLLAAYLCSKRSAAESSFRRIGSLPKLSRRRLRRLEANANGERHSRSEGASRRCARRFFASWAVSAPPAICQKLLKPSVIIS